MPNHHYTPDEIRQIMRDLLREEYGLMPTTYEPSPLYSPTDSLQALPINPTIQHQLDQLTRNPLPPLPVSPLPPLPYGPLPDD